MLSHIWTEEKVSADLFGYLVRMSICKDIANAISLVAPLLSTFTLFASARPIHAGFFLVALLLFFVPFFLTRRHNPRSLSARQLAH